MEFAIPRQAQIKNSELARVTIIAQNHRVGYLIFVNYHKTTLSFLLDDRLIPSRIYGPITDFGHHAACSVSLKKL